MSDYDKFSKAEVTYSRFGFAPRLSGVDGKPNLAILSSGLAIVRCDHVPAEVYSREWQRSPYFENPEGNLTFLFLGAGKIEPVELLDRFTVQSWAPRAIGFETRVDNFLTAPPSNGLVWLREPSFHRSGLPGIPTSIRLALTQMTETA